MSADIIILPIVRVERCDEPPNLGNGAREALIEIGRRHDHFGGPKSEMWTDLILLELWSAGFKVVPIE